MYLSTPSSLFLLFSEVSSSCILAYSDKSHEKIWMVTTFLSYQGIEKRNLKSLYQNLNQQPCSCQLVDSKSALSQKSTPAEVCVENILSLNCTGLTSHTTFEYARMLKSSKWKKEEITKINYFSRTSYTVVTFWINKAGPNSWQMSTKSSTKFVLNCSRPLGRSRVLPLSLYVESSTWKDMIQP